MNPYSIPTFITAFSLFGLGIVIYKRGKKNKANDIFFSLSISIATWLFFVSIAYNCADPLRAEMYMRICYVGIIFMPITTFHFVAEFLKINIYKYLIFILYGVGFLFAFFMLKGNYFISGLHSYFWGKYPKAGSGHPLFLIFLFSLAFISISLLLRFYFGSNATPLRKNQVKYILIAYFFLACSTVDFIPVYGIPLYPLGYIPVATFLLIIAYSTIKYRVLDITIAVTRTGIFLAVYSMVLGIPFVFAFGWREQLKILMGEMWWLAPLISSTVLATVGPSIYLYIQRRAEALLLQEQRRYQATLRRASLGMGRVKDLRRLLKLTVNIVTRTVRIEHCEIYLSHKLSERYILKASQGWSSADDKRVSFIPTDAPLIQYLKRYREPLVYDEVKQRGQDFRDQVLEETGKIMEALDAALLVPSFIEEELLAILVLGKKRSGKLYSHDDLIVFSILANQAALAIENAQFYEDMKKTHDQLMKAEKMATIGTMADGLSHQINNRLHAMGFIASDALDTIKLQPREGLQPEAKKVYEEMEVSLGKIQENVKRGGEIVEGLLKYSRKPDEGFAAIELGKLLDAALEMAQFKIKLSQIDIARNFNGSISKIRGNFTQLQEVFFNMVDNSYDAMMQRKEEMKEPGYRGRLEISAREEGSHLEILIKDNGMGVKEKDFKRLFTPFFTTKLSSKKGTGLGLYVLRKIIEENHGGKVEFTSEYQKGSQTRLVLPIAV